MKKLKFWKKKPDKNQGKKNKTDAVKLVFKLVPSLLIIILLSFIIKEVFSFLMASPQFFVDTTDVYIDGKPVAPQLAGRYNMKVSSNIFRVDINWIRNCIYARHSEIKHISVSRRLPNKIAIDMEMREPAVQVKAGRYYPVDKDGIVLIDVSDAPNPRLPVLAGAQGKMGSLDIGIRINTPNFKQAKDLLRAVIKSEFLRKHRFLYVDCFDARNLSFYIDDNLEIKMGYGKYDEKLDMLGKIFDKLNKDMTNIKYIDLRFKDVVIGPRMEK